MTTTITVYSKPRCQQCVATKRRLDANGHKGQYAVEDGTEPGNREAILALGYQQLPVVIVSNGDVKNDQHWSGFRPDLIDQFAPRVAE